MTEFLEEKFSTGIYIRVSTEEQAREGFSINGQKEKLKQYAYARGWDIYDFYIDDGISGKNLKDRPQVLKMLEDIKSGKVNNVLVYKIDRLTRSTKNLIELIDLFNDNDCAFNSLMEAIDTSTATGRMFIKIVGIFAEFERENLAERVSFGYEQKTREGNYTNVNGVYGYDYVVGSGELLVNEQEAELVREIYNLYLQGNSMLKISKYLKDKQVPTKRGGVWSSSTISSILTNPLYIGKVRYGVMTRKKTAFAVDSDKHEKIISEDTFYRVQELAGKRKQYQTRKYPSENAYFLTFLKCSMCDHLLGSTSYSSTSKKGKTINVNYYCPNSKMEKCEATGFSHRKIERAFEEYLLNFNEFAFDDTLLQKQKALENEEKARNLEGEISNTQKKAEKIQALFMQDKMTFEEYQEFTSVLNKKISLLEEELLPLQKEEKEEADIEAIIDIVVNMKKNWVNLSNEEKKHFLTMFVEYIKAYSDKGVVKVTDMEFTKVKKLTR